MGVSKNVVKKVLEHPSILLNIFLFFIIKCHVKWRKNINMLIIQTVSYIVSILN